MQIFLPNFFKKNFYELASGLAVLYISYRHRQAIKIEKQAQAKLREQLAGRRDLFSLSKIFSSHCYAILLDVPGMNVVSLYAYSVLFPSQKPLKNRNLPPLLEAIKHLPALAQDLTLEAANGDQQPFYLRKGIVREIATIFGRQKKNSPLLIGHHGVGKRAIFRGIAQQIVDNDPQLPEIFKGKRIFLLTYNDLIRGLKPGEEINRLNELLNEASICSEQAFVFFHDIHLILRYADTIATISYFLTRNKISLIGATTPSEYEKLIKAHPEIQELFTEVQAPEPSPEEAEKIMRLVIPWMEAHHALRIGDEALKVCIELGHRHIKTECFPSKAMDLLDEAASAHQFEHPPNSADRQLALELKALIQTQPDSSKIQGIRNQFSQEVKSDQIRTLISKKVQIPLSRLSQSEQTLLMNLETSVSKKIIGQKAAIKSLCQAVCSACVKLGNENRPAGVFFLLGPSGVGKTETARVLAEILFGSNEHFLCLDMSEFHDRADINKLIGSPPGYEGHQENGRLTDFLKNNPRSIVLFDEIEKAHRSIHNLLLGLFGAARLTDGQGRTVICPDAIFLMTSNFAAPYIIKEHSKLRSLPENTTSFFFRKQLQAQFKQEFVGRMQQIVVYFPLSKAEILQITALQCTELQERVNNNPQCPNLKISWDDTLLQFFADNYYELEGGGGARGISDGIKMHLEHEIASLIVNQKVNPGDELFFSASNNSVKVEIKKPSSNSSNGH